MKFHLVTFGCQMNKADSEHLAGLLTDAGHTPAGPDTPDVIVFLSCAVRQSAENRLFGHLGQLKANKGNGHAPIVAVGGCVAQKEQAILSRQFPAVDIVFGTDNYARLPELLETYLDKREPICSTDGGHQPTGVRRVALGRSRRGWIPISRGCDNFCTYCIVPHVRGRERSRPLGEVLREAEMLAVQGVVEATLLGQNVNSYGKDLGETHLFARLLRSLDRAKLFRRIRFVTSHPKDLTKETIEAMAGSETVCEHLHLPLQTGSDRVLARMNRGYTAARYVDLVQALRAAIPDCSITTDLIAGFPGETDADFEKTLDLVASIRFDQAFTFLYSPRPGTPAATLGDDVAPAIKQYRLERLIEIQNEISRQKNEALVGQELEILVEGPSKRHRSMLAGRTRTNKTVNFPAPAAPYTLIKVLIELAGPYSLRGRPCGSIDGRRENSSPER